MKKYSTTKRWISITILSLLLLSACTEPKLENNTPDPNSAIHKDPSDMPKQEWLPVILSDEVVKAYLEYNTSDEPVSAIYSLYLSTTKKTVDYADSEFGNIVIKNIDDVTAIAIINYRDGSTEEVRLIKDPKHKDRWFPIEYYEKTPPQYEEKFVIISYRDGNFYYDEAEWVMSDQTERIKELEALGIKMSFENGYYVYNEKEIFVPLKIDQETKFYLLAPSLSFFEAAQLDRFQKNVEDKVFNGYYEIYVKDGKPFKIFQVYVP